MWYAISQKEKEMKKIKVGDIVTRDGTDKHIVEEIFYYNSMLTVKCILEPDDKWIKFEETESNLASRYSLV